MDIDIPLPGEEIPLSEIEPPDIPMPEEDPPEPFRRISPEPRPVSSASDASEHSQDHLDFDPPLPPMPAPKSVDEEEDDPDRYSPSGMMEEDDLPMPELPQVIPPLLPPPPPPPSLAPLPPPTAPRSPSPPESPPPLIIPQARSLVLGKTQAKKRLLAFSMTKQGGGAGVSFNLAKKQTINKESAKGFTEDKDETKKKPPKKGTVDKARDTISEIEELKRKEMQLLENMQTLHPRWGIKDVHNLPAVLPLQLADNLDSMRSIDISGLVGEVLAKKSKREAEKRKEKARSRSPSDGRRRSKSKREKERRSRKKVMPHSWREFKKEGHKINYFRRFKHEVEKREHEMREKKRHKRSRSRSRSRDRSKPEKSPSKRGARVNMLEAPMVIKKVLVAVDMHGVKDIDYPEYLVRYTKTRPPLTFCENPKVSTYHLQSRKKMLSTVPRDIEEIIIHFLKSIRPKRWRPKPEVPEVFEEEQHKKEDKSVVCVKNDVESCDQIVSDEVEKNEEVDIVPVPKEELVENDDQAEKTDITVTEKEMDENCDDEKKEDTSEQLEGEENEEDKEINKCEQIEKEDENEPGELEDTSDSKIDIEENKSPNEKTPKSKEIEIEHCNLKHRSWFQKKQDWMVVSIPLEEEDDIEIEEFDSLPDVIEVGHYSDSKGFNGTDAGFDQRNNYKPRSRNISQSSANVINEELEPIIKSAIRSKWDSDYEESDEEPKPEERKEEAVVESKSFGEFTERDSSRVGHDVQDISNDNLGVVPMEVEDVEDDMNSTKYSEEKWAESSQEEVKHDSQEDSKQDPPDVVEKLASEYEEFMKMLGSEDQEDEVLVGEDYTDNREDKSTKQNETVNLESNWEEPSPRSQDNFDHNDALSVNDDSQLQNDSEAIEKKSDELTLSQEKPNWESTKVFSNRSRSVSSSRSVNIKNIEEAIFKHKILKEALKKKKTKVQGSKIKKNLKDRHKKSKKKRKRDSSSDSSSSSSSSSSYSSSSSSTSSSSSSDDSSSESSSDSESSSSSDSSIELKKLKKQKHKKLKAKLKRKKKKKQTSSSDTSESSDDELELKRRKKKKSRLANRLKKKKSKDKIAKGKKNKKSKVDISDNEISRSVFKKRSKKKRKKSDDEEIDIEDIPKKKKSKLDIKLEEALKSQKKDKTGKLKKTSKSEKEKKKKEEVSRKGESSKKKSSKDKLKPSEEKDDDDIKKSSKSKSKDKKQKKSEKKQKDLFLEFGESLKASKKLKTSEVERDKFEENINKTGIKMSEEDFDISNNVSTTVYCNTRNSIAQETISEDKAVFLGQNKRLTEEDFEQECKPCKPELLETRAESYQLNVKQPDKPFLLDDKELDKSKKKSKKEKKKKKEKEKILVDALAEGDKKKKKKKKEKKSKKSARFKEQLDTKENLDSSFEDLGTSLRKPPSSFADPKNSDILEELAMSQNRIDFERSDRRIFRHNSQESVHSKSSLSPSRKSKSGPMNDWSDDSETRGCFLKQRTSIGFDVTREFLHDVSNEKRNVDDIKIPGLGFDSQSGDGFEDSSGKKVHPMGECEKKMEELDEDFARKNQEQNSFFENILKNSEKSLTQEISLTIPEKKRDSTRLEQAKKEETGIVEGNCQAKLVRCGSSPYLSEDMHSQPDSLTMEKETPNHNKKSNKSEVFIEYERNSGGATEQLTYQNSKSNDDSERYSPTLDLDVMSPASNEKMDSDMSLDSNDAESGKVESNINMLDIPLPPSGLPLQKQPLLPPPLPPIPVPVPPPVMPVPPPSFKNILGLPPKPSVPPSEQKASVTEQPKITEFKTTVSEINSSSEMKSIFTDPLKIPITKKLNFGKQVQKLLKPMNIFEDDDQEGDESSQQGMSKLPVDLGVNHADKSSLDIAVEKAEEKLKNKNTQAKNDIVTVEKPSLKNVKDFEDQRKDRENTTQNVCIDVKLVENSNKDIAKENDKQTMKNKSENDIFNTQKQNAGGNFLNITSANLEVENARDAWRDSDDSSNVIKSTQHDSNLEKVIHNQNVDANVANVLVNVTVKKEVVSDDQTNEENIDRLSFDPNLEIKQEPESDVSQEVPSEKSEDGEGGADLEESKRLLDEEKKRKEYEDSRASKRRGSSRERRDRVRRDSSRDRRRNRSRSRSRDRRRDRSRERHRRDSPDRRNRRRERSRERSRRDSRDRRREKSPRGRRESPRDRSPRRVEGSVEARSSVTEKRIVRSDSSVEKRLVDPSKLSKQVSPPRRLPSPYKSKPSPFRSPSPRKRSISPLLKSPLYQKRPIPSHFNRSPSPFRSSPSRRVVANRSPSPRRTISPPRRGLSPQRRPLSPQRRPLSPQKRSSSPQKRPLSPQRRPLSPQRRQLSPPQRRPSSPQRRPLSPQRRTQSPQRRPPSPKSPYRSPYRSPSPYRRQSPLRISSPTKRYLSPSRKPPSPWRPPSPPKRPFSPSRRPSSPGKRPSPTRPLLKLPSPTRRPLSPWRPPSPPNIQKSQKKPKPKSPQKGPEYSGRNPSPLGFKRSLADSTISDSDLPPIKKITRNAVLSPKRLPLDDRIELELGVKKSPPPPPPPGSFPGFQSFYQIPVHGGSQVQVQPTTQQRRNTNLVQPPRLEWDVSQPLLRQGKSTQVFQVGNMLQVVPTEAMPVLAATAPLPVPGPVPGPGPTPPAPTKVKPGASQSTVVQVGNMLQVVPSTLVTASRAAPAPSVLSLPLPLMSPSPPEAPPPPPSTATTHVTSPLLLPLPVAKKNIKVDEAALRRMEKERRRREKEIKRQQKITKQMIRKALLLKDTYPTVSELASQEQKQAEEAQEEPDEPLEILTTPIKPKVMTPLPPPPDKGILISPGFRAFNTDPRNKSQDRKCFDREKPLKEEKVRKNVSFADGVQPGEGDEGPTEEHPHSPPPLPNEKHFKKGKKKRKVRVRIIRVEDGEDDEDEDDSTPPPPPPGSPPPMFHYPPPPPGFMYVPPQSFTVLQGGEGLTPLYQQHHSSTTTTHTTTVQFAPPLQHKQKAK